jgi:hypothetical protein
MPNAQSTKGDTDSLPVLHPGDGPLKPVPNLYEALGLRRPHPGSVWRICSRGTVRAGRLPALHVQGGWHSTKDALAAWLELGTAAALNDSRSKVVIDEELRAAGLLDSSPSAASDEELHDGSPQSNNP